jgi:hypothetical protein
MNAVRKLKLGFPNTPRISGLLSMMTLKALHRGCGQGLPYAMVHVGWMKPIWLL